MIGFGVSAMIDRREILKGTAAVAVAAALPSVPVSVQSPLDILGEVAALVGDAGRFYSYTRTIKWNAVMRDSAMWNAARIVETWNAARIVEQGSVD